MTTSPSLSRRHLSLLPRSAARETVKFHIVDFCCAGCSRASLHGRGRLRIDAQHWAEGAGAGCMQAVMLSLLLTLAMTKLPAHFLSNSTRTSQPGPYLQLYKLRPPAIQPMAIPLVSQHRGLQTIPCVSSFS